MRGKQALIFSGTAVIVLISIFLPSALLNQSKNKIFDTVNFSEIVVDVQAYYPRISLKSKILLSIMYTYSSKEAVMQGNALKMEKAEEIFLKSADMLVFNGEQSFQGEIEKNGVDISLVKISYRENMELFNYVYQMSMHGDAYYMDMMIDAVTGMLFSFSYVNMNCTEEQAREFASVSSNERMEKNIIELFGVENMIEDVYGADEDKTFCISEEDQIYLKAERQLYPKGPTYYSMNISFMAENAGITTVTSYDAEG